MFENVGSKIKSLAQAVAWIGIISSIIIGFIVISADEGAELIGFIIMIIGSFLSWISSLTTYGFGQLIENSDKLVKVHSVKNNGSLKKEEVIDKNKIETLRKWKEEGLITEQEYNEKISEL